MKQYGVILTQGNDSKVLEVCRTKEAALNIKHQLKGKYSAQNARIDAVWGDFDENGDLSVDRFRVLY